MEPLDRAIEILGSQAALAKSLGVVQSAIANWRSRGRVPAEYCPAIELACSKKVLCEELRPDVQWHVLRGVGIETAAQAEAA